VYHCTLTGPIGDCFSRQGSMDLGHYLLDWLGLGIPTKFLQSHGNDPAYRTSYGSPIQDILLMKPEATD